MKGWCFYDGLFDIMKLFFLRGIPFKIFILLNHTLQWFHNLGEVRYELSQEVDFSEKRLHGPFATRGRNLGDGFCMFWVHHYAILGYDVAQHIPFKYCKDDLLGVK